MALGYALKLSLGFVMVIALSVAACAGILGIRPRDASHPFEHRAHVAKGINCVACHSGIATSGKDAALHLPTDATCLGCHKKPHDTRSCLACHGAEYEREGAGTTHQHLRFAHADHLAEVKGDCVRCHESVALARPDSLLPKMATCFECHQHREEWTQRSCDGCHVDLAGEDTPPESHLVHDGDWLREHGTRAASAADLCVTCHSERSCASCHGVGTTPTLPARLAFDDVPLAGLHRAGFRARHADEARSDPGLCTTCHSPSACQGCHDREHVSPLSGAASPHPVGWVTAGNGGGDHGAQARMDPTACAGCHSGAGEQLCVGCHRVGGPGGNPHGAGFRSDRSKTHDLPCRLCHGVGP